LTAVRVPLKLQHRRTKAEYAQEFTVAYDSGGAALFMAGEKLLTIIRMDKVSTLFPELINVACPFIFGV
jgi:hypothetical protein